MCSNSTHRPDADHHRRSSVKFDYTPAKEHYRAGVIVSDGVSYVGAFRQPGERGHFYAINAGLNTKYWDFATKLDAMSDGARNIYTATNDGATRLDFTDRERQRHPLQRTLGVGHAGPGQRDLIGWVRSTRFGVHQHHRRRCPSSARSRPRRRRS